MYILVNMINHFYIFFKARSLVTFNFALSYAKPNNYSSTLSISAVDQYAIDYSRKGTFVTLNKVIIAPLNVEFYNSVLV